MPQVVVTGGNGYIGSHTVVSLINNGMYPIIIDNRVNSHGFILDNIASVCGKNSYSFYHTGCDNINDINVVPDGIIHFAAHKSVGESVRNPILYYNNNINSLLNVLSYIEQYQVRNFVFSSSCTVYGRPDSCPVNEDSEIREASNPYGQTKIICEKIIGDFYKQHNHLNCIVLRYFNPIGANNLYNIGEISRRPPENLMSRLLRFVCGRDNFVVHGGDYNTPDGSAIRDYLDVNDLANCHVGALKYMMGGSGIFKTYNVGTGTGVSVFEIIDAMSDVVGRSLDIEVGPKRQGDIDRTFADSTRIQQDLGFVCVVPLRQSIEESWIWQQYLNKCGY